MVVSDYRMPGLDGVQFLSRVKHVSPDTVRILLTGHADLKTAIEAVNEGEIFRLLTTWDGSIKCLAKEDGFISREVNYLYKESAKTGCWEK